jgi:hypothetical protein
VVGEQLEFEFMHESTSKESTHKEHTNMAKVVKKSDDPGFFAHGGKTKMFGKGSAGPAKPDISGKESNDLGGGEWAKGGSTKMFGKGSAGFKVPGISGKESQVG